MAPCPLHLHLHLSMPIPVPSIPPLPSPSPSLSPPSPPCPLHSHPCPVPSIPTLTRDSRSDPLPPAFPPQTQSMGMVISAYVHESALYPLFYGQEPLAILRAGVWQQRPCCWLPVPAALQPRLLAVQEGEGVPQLQGEPGLLCVRLPLPCGGRRGGIEPGVPPPAPWRSRGGWSQCMPLTSAVLRHLGVPGRALGRQRGAGGWHSPRSRLGQCRARQPPCQAGEVGGDMEGDGDGEGARDVDPRALLGTAAAGLG